MMGNSQMCLSIIFVLIKFVVILNSDNEVDTKSVENSTSFC